MKAVVVRSPGGVEQLEVREGLPFPSLSSQYGGDNALVVKIKAAGLNGADVVQREGKYPPPPGASDILGLEMSGVVEEVHGQLAQEAGWQAGDRVCALLPGGGYAEYAIIPHEMAMRIPEGLTFEDAAGIPEAFLTAWQALKWLGDLGDNKTVLIHAAASGVGTSAIQLVKQFKGTNILVTAGSHDKIEFCKQLGASAGFNRNDGPWLEGVLNAAPNGVDIIIDFVGATYWEQNVKALAMDGTMIILSHLGGSNAPSFDMAPILRKRLNIRGSTLRARSIDYKITLTKDFAAFALPRFSDGRLKAIIDKVVPWEKVADAHAHLEAVKNIGKVIISGM